MSPEITKAIEGLTAELNAILLKASEIKKTINQLFAMNGENPPYTDVEFSSFGGIANIESDQFFGKGVSTAVKEYLRMKGRAATAKEIYEVLQKGGFEFPEDWKTENQLKNLAISISKNRYDFCPVPTSEGNAFGLWEFYPEKKKEREKKLSSNNQEENKSDVEKKATKSRKKVKKNTAEESNKDSGEKVNEEKD